MEFLAAAAAVCLLVWAGVIALRGGPLAGCLVFMALATCFGYHFFNFEAGFATLTIDRAAWVFLMLLAIVWRRRGWSAPKPLNAADKLVLAFVGYLAVRTLLTDSHGTGLTPLVNFFLWYGMPLGLYWVMRQTQFGKRQNALVLGCMAFFGLYLAATVIAERFEAYSLVFPRYIITSMSDKKAEFVGRGRGPLLHPIITGIQLAACFFATLMLWPRVKRMGRAAVAVAAAIFLLAFYSTMTRSVWMGAGLGLIVIAAFTTPPKWRAAGLLAAVAAVGIFATANWDQLVAFKRDKNLSARETADSVTLRPVMAEVAWLMVLDRPIFGCGFDQYEPEHLNYLADRSTDVVLEKSRPYAAHNLFFGVVTETGLVGLGLFVALLIAWSHDAWSLWRTKAAPLWMRQQGLLFLTVLSAYLVNGMFHHIALIPMPNLLLFFVAGMNAAVRPAVCRVDASSDHSQPLVVEQRDLQAVEAM